MPDREQRPGAGSRLLRVAAPGAILIGLVVTGLTEFHPLHRASAAFVWLFSGTLFRHWFVFRGRAQTAPLFLSALEVLAFLGVASRPVGGWGLALVGLSTFVIAGLREQEEEAVAHVVERCVPVVVGALLVTLVLARPDREVSLHLVLAILVTLEGLWPWASRSVQAVVTRVAGLSLAGAGLLIQRDDGSGGVWLDFPVLLAASPLVAAMVLLGPTTARAKLERFSARLAVGVGLLGFHLVQTGGVVSGRNALQALATPLALEALVRLAPSPPSAVRPPLQSRPWRHGGALLASSLLAALAPTAQVRAVGVGITLAILAVQTCAFTIEAGLVARLGAVCLAFGVGVFALDRHVTLPGRIADVCLVGLATLIWLWAARREIDAVPTSEQPLGPVLGVVGVALALNLGPLGAPILWRGDEGYHLTRLMAVQEILRLGGVVLVMVLAGAFLLVRVGAPRWIRDLLPLGGALASVLALRPDPGLNRYPLLEAWWQGVLAVTPSWPQVVGFHRAEGWGRLLPLASVLSVAAGLAARLPLSALPRALLALLFVTLPSVRYYATINYLELPLVALMLAAVLSLRSGTSASSGVPRGLAFLGLLAIPFTKETAVPFLGALWVHGLWAAWRESPTGGRGLARDLARGTVLYLVPAWLVLYLRPPGIRAYQPTPTVLLEPALYRLMPRFLLEEFGIVPLLALIGLVLAWRRGRRAWSCLCGALVAGYLAFFAMDGGLIPFPDGVRLPAYWGYSRFMLLLLPAGFALTVEAVAGEGLGRVGAVVLGLGIAVNLALSPVDLTGRRRSYWGDYVTTTSEFDYPYDRAIPLATRDSAQVTVVGLCSSYDVDFYLSRAPKPVKAKAILLPESHLQAAFRDLEALGVIEPGSAVAAIRSDFTKAVQAAPGTSVIVHLLPGDVTSTWPETLEGLTRCGEFRYGDRRLLVYGAAR